MSQAKRCVLCAMCAFEGFDDNDKPYCYGFKSKIAMPHFIPDNPQSAFDYCRKFILLSRMRKYLESQSDLFKGAQSYDGPESAIELR